MASTATHHQAAKRPLSASPSQADTVLHLEDPQSDTDTTTPAKPASSTIRHLFAFTPAAHLPLLAASLTTAAVLAAARTAYAVLLGRIFDVVSRFGAGAIAPPDFLAQVSQWAVWLCVLGVGIWAFATLDVAAWIVGGEMRARRAREEVFATLLRRRVGWFEGRAEGVGGLVVGVATQTRELQTATSQTLGFLARDAFLFIGCTVAAFLHSYQLTLVMLATAVPSALILWAIGSFLNPAIEGQKRELAQAAKHVNAAVAAIDLVKVYNTADHETFQFTAAIKRSARFYSRQMLCNCGQMSYIKLWMIMLFVLGFYFAVILVDSGDLTPGDALTTFYAVLNAFQSAETFGPQWLVLAKGMAAGQALQKLVNDNSEQTAETSGWRKPSKCDGEIRINNVTFAYPSNPTKTVLRSSTLRFEARQLTFVVGRSGSGKSTLGSLLVRFYEPLTGQITVDGSPISILDLDWLRRNVTLIQQSSTLFKDIFFQNVAFGALDPTDVSRDAVRDACNMAVLQSVIADMPDGINTVVGPGGHSLSGGQKQRLALARARLRDPPVLILDEITSGLDPVSKALVMEAIRIWRKGKTTIIITHEIGHIEDDEYVYVLADGAVVQRGLRREISADQDGLFSSLVASADDSSSDLSSIDTESEYDSNISDIEPLQEAQFAKFIRGALIDNRPMSMGLSPRFSVRRDSVLEKTIADRPPPRRTGTRGSSTKLTNSSPPKSAAGKPLLGLAGRLSTHIMTQRGLLVQQARVPDARAALKGLDAEHQASMDSLELFFLERLAKPKDRKKPPSRPTLPSLKAILKTVWPTLDKAGRAELIFGVLMCLVVAASTPVFSFFFANLIAGFWASDGEEGSTTTWTGALAAVAVVDASATFFAYFLMEKVAQRWVNTLRAEAVRRILSQPKPWFDKDSHSPNRITQCLDRNAEEMRKLVGMFVPIMLTVTAMVFSSVIWALVIRFDLTLVALSGLPAAVIAARANSLASDKWEAVCDAAAASANAVFSETFTHVKVVRALTQERYFSDKHAQSAAAAYRVGVRRGCYVGTFFGLHQSLGYFLTALVFFYAAKILSEGLTTVTDAVRVINLLLFSIGTSVAMLANVPQIAAAKTTAVQMLYYANLSPAASHESHGDARLANPLPVRMTNLRFAYPGAPHNQVLRNITLQLDAGTCTAIVGASGCGKSTLASLLLRLYDPLRPSTPLHHPLTYAAHPASALHTPALRTHMAYVPQTPFLFPASARANLTYGLHEGSALRGGPNVALAARQAAVDALVASLPQGYDTPLGDGGQPVSGGQAQRLCIARALARRPRLLVLDEPTSALDAAAAAEVRRVVQGLVRQGGERQSAREGMAVVVVTHCREMMRMADRVVMVEDGVVVESGTYEQLVARGGKFAGLVGGGGSSGGAQEGKRKGKDAARGKALRRLEGEE